MRSMFRGGVALALTLFGLIGCNLGGAPDTPPGVEVGGKIFTANGAPLQAGLLVLRPEDGIHGASGEIQPDGGFTLTDPKGNKSVVPGAYRVYVLFHDAKHQKIAAAVPSRYRNTESGDSDVVVGIHQATTDLRIQLKR